MQPICLHNPPALQWRPSQRIGAVVPDPEYTVVRVATGVAVRPRERGTMTAIDTIATGSAAVRHETALIPGRTIVFMTASAFMAASVLLVVVGLAVDMPAMMLVGALTLVADIMIGIHSGINALAAE